MKRILYLLLVLVVAFCAFMIADILLANIVDYPGNSPGAGYSWDGGGIVVEDAICTIESYEISPKSAATYSTYKRMNLTLATLQETGTSYTLVEEDAAQLAALG